MSESEYTPGPWLVFIDPRHGQVFVPHPKQPGNLQIADVDGMDIREVAANTNLIAAAPDLHEAAKAALQWIARNTPLVDSAEPIFGEIADEADKVRKQLNIALAKAEGKNT